jgi:hypothetical protein
MVANPKNRIGRIKKRVSRRPLEMSPFSGQRLPPVSARGCPWRTSFASSCPYLDLRPRWKTRVRICSKSVLGRAILPSASACHRLRFRTYSDPHAGFKTQAFTDCAAEICPKSVPPSHPIRSYC